MQNRRHTRVRELLKRELSAILQREIPLSEGGGLFTVNEVLVSNDLRNATVFLGFFGSGDQQRRGWALLRKHQSRIQDELARAVVLKNTPRLRFETDDSVVRGDRVLEILNQLEEDLPPTEEPQP